MIDAPQTGARCLRLRYRGTCRTCGIALSAGTEALWDRATKQATCVACAPEPAEVTESVAGASAAAEGERRTSKRVDDVRRRYGDHAVAVAVEMAGHDAAATWGKGSVGESRLAAYVLREVGDGVIALHDRLIPGTKGNIDHVFVAPTGVWVVDAKAYKGKVVKRDVGPLWRTENQVFVGGRNRTSLVKGVEKQADCVRAALKGDPVSKGTDIHAALPVPGRLRMGAVRGSTPQAAQEERAALTRGDGAHREEARPQPAAGKRLRLRAPRRSRCRLPQWPHRLLFRSTP